MIRVNKLKIIRLSFLMLVALALLIALTALNGPNALASSDIQNSIESAGGGEASIVAPRVQAAIVSIDLCASDGSVAMPDGTNVPVWGFVNTGGGSCTTGLVTSLPGPELHVNAGDMVTINLTNALSENVSILISGQNLTASGGVSGTFAAEAVANGGTVSYGFTAQEGPYLYESGTNASIQIPMGLYGALIVDSGISGQAYGSTFDQEAVLLLSEIDPNLNANPGGFDLLEYHPIYWMINGEAYPNTADIMANAGEQVLLRYLNAGFDHLSMALLGGYQTVIAKDGFPLTNAFGVTAEIIPASTTADMIVDTSGLEGALPLYNRNMYVTNGTQSIGGLPNPDHYPGGLLTFLQVQAPIGNLPTVDIVNPAQGGTVYGDAVTIQIDASDVEDALGTLTVEWNLDGGGWQTATWTGAFYEATWDTTVVSDGVHTLNARGTDSDANTVSDSHSVLVSNLPAVSVVSPAEGATIFGDVVLVQIDASDAEDAAGTLAVVFDVDGVATMGATYNGVSGYYEATLDTTGLADGAHAINAQTTDSRSNNAVDSNNVSVSNEPSVSIVTPAEGATVFSIVTVQIDASDVEDAAGTLTVMWDLDGGTPEAAIYNGVSGYYEASWDTSASGSGAHTINASATDSRGNIATDSNNVTVGSNSIHIGDLDGASTPGGGPNWTASVTAVVHFSDESLMQGATVTIDATRISKSDGSLVVTTLSCVTDASGQCTVSRTVNSNQYENTVTFTVTNITNSAPYQSGDNHDPDGNSDGTTIVVAQ